ncbi:hypothetical protein DL89DRAFT_64822 [Linderina pennispora]|uniref:Cyclin N-terminal domain-containing protein n=1 Tax=Linderina pennispora TaxID=61395 RepID=A0A1Y1VZ71_9FUNG|nr:uncharacterized protein DL89DRAFT_64822 [Linderina pennispora]ORX66560.1 hypothetical protein DL89DRAFT_64822 [Linderina pennispora]
MAAACPRRLPRQAAQGLSTIPPLDLFITNLVLRSRVQAGTLICTLVYLQRLRRRLPKEARGMECTCHRIFLATLIVAGKYLNDSSPKNKYWARYSTVFTVAEVNLMEKQLLFLLDFDLRIDNNDLNDAAAAFLPGPPKASAPLTPTTPTFGGTAATTTATATATNSSSSSSSSSSAVTEVSSVPAIVTSQPREDSAGYHHPTTSGLQPTKQYPPTLGLDSVKHRHAMDNMIPPTEDASSRKVAEEMQRVRGETEHYQRHHGRTHSVASIDMVSARESRRCSQ